MAPHPLESLRTRNATQAFLRSSSEDPAFCPDSRAPEVVFSENPFPDMLDRNDLMRAVMDQMAHVPLFQVLSVDIEAAVRTAVAAAESTDAAFAAAMAPLAEFCRTQGGIWGRISCFRFACVIAEDTPDTPEPAEALRSAYEKAEQFLVFIGTAAYPTLNDTRADIIENADKALDHGAFFGAGTITRYDAVTQNINGDRLYQAGNLQGAIDAFKKGLRLDPMDANLHNSLGVCYGVLGDFENALAAFETAIWLAPDDVMAVYNTGYLLLCQRDTKAALARFLEANTLEPDVFEVVFHIGQTWLKMENPEAAQPFLTSAVRVSPRSAPAAALLGECLEALGQVHDAIQAYKQAVKINPEDASSLSAMGYLYASLGESLDVAVLFCEKSVELSPENGLFYHRLGEVYVRQDRLDDALAAFSAAQSLGYDSQPWMETLRARQVAVKAS
ncbi:tetratricopeptide repeat protein [Desulfosarcina sp. OttesenSCG-928-G10]|nr:tetratricopeptide repeat protein [Desulfosarcina sp. OttesenSCG-928-G10]MDL2320870.1 tetratricopeptide repeat protein [Desulfosarcina sp. OttesenSCG-928-B08]